MTTRLWRGPMLVVALASMTYGLWLGLLRLGWSLPLAWPDQLALHGPLMIGGFLGTLVGLERAIGVARRWAFAAPICSAAGTLLLVFRTAPLAGAVLLTAASLVVTLVFITVLRRQLSLFALTMAAGALCWLAGNIYWAAGAAIYRVVFWWVAFIVLTIAGERLELNRLLRPSALVRAAFVGAALVVVCGVVAIAWGWPDQGAVMGAGLLGLAVWLARNDIARRTIRRRGLTQFMAVCLLAGYVWLGASGILLLATHATTTGNAYDAVLHSIFVGFVVSMIFGHAPIVLPAVLGVTIRHRTAAYLPLAVLHLSLLLRVVGDLVDVLGRLRAWGGAGNALAIALFAAGAGREVLRDMVVS